MTNSRYKTKKRNKYATQAYYCAMGAFAICWSEGLPWALFLSYSLGFIIGCIILYILSVYAKPFIKRLFSSK